MLKVCLLLLIVSGCATSEDKDLVRCSATCEDCKAVKLECEVDVSETITIGDSNASAQN